MSNTITIHPRREWSCFRYHLSDVYDGSKVTMLEVHEQSLNSGEWRQPTRHICTTSHENAALLQRLCDALNALNSFEQSHWNPYINFGDAQHAIENQAKRKELAAEVEKAENAIDELNALILADEQKDEDEQTKEVK